MEIQDRAEERETSGTKFWWILILTLAVVVILISLRPFVFAVYRMPSASMEDALLVGDRVLVTLSRSKTAGSIAMEVPPRAKITSNGGCLALMRKFRES